MSRAISQETRRCSFCRKGQGAAGKLIASPGEHPRAYICGECVGVCETLEHGDRVRSDEVASSEADPGGSLRGLFAWYRRKHPAGPCCSFCGKAKEAAQELMQELIASPDRRAYICHDCLTMCRHILAEGATLSSLQGARVSSGRRSL
jgi:ATP-dependent protease Clp ATPase subunit